ncbi:fibronectin type III domain-containing protein [Aliarcobacter lanthieri]|uniref:fibronectin type III domain-containing protein n=1 Tax=Aliarcobacter lanthieri TaxID=1355374 RepID=UPI00047D6467|nr:fibronectin type III domain-containing protein [Aliarcobacter lanthieri]QKF59511.1 fibronectin type III domain-containing protein [Aliarcobacter lanthieri]
MIKLKHLISLIALIFLISGCANIFNTTTTPKVNNSFQTVNYNSIKSIPDMVSIGFEWQRIDDPRVEGYNFYRTELNKGENTLKLIKATNSRYVTHYVDKGLEPKTKYAYQISARLNDGSESPTTQAYIVETLPRITPVAYAQAISNLPRKVKLIWQPHPDTRVSYYRVEKYNTFINEWIYKTKIDQRLSAEYIETGLKDNTTHKYRIKAFSFDDVESAPSPILQATTKPAPLPPKNIRASNNIPKSVFITWERSPTQDVVQYQIHRSSYRSLGYSKIATVNADTLEYTDKINNDAKEYFYKVIAVDKDGLESTDDIDAIKGITLAPPAKPTITLAQIQGNKVILNWQAGDSRAVSYNVNKRVKKYLVFSDTTKFENINGLRFEDNDIVSGIEYHYSVQAVDEFGTLSSNSDEAKVTLSNSRI